MPSSQHLQCTIAITVLCSRCTLLDVGSRFTSLGGNEAGWDHRYVGGLQINAICKYEVVSLLFLALLSKERKKKGKENKKAKVGVKRISLAKIVSL